MVSLQDDMESRALLPVGAPMRLALPAVTSVSMMNLHRETTQLQQRKSQRLKQHATSLSYVNNQFACVSFIATMLRMRATHTVAIVRHDVSLSGLYSAARETKNL
jgi:hypothetical protein